MITANQQRDWLDDLLDDLPDKPPQNPARQALAGLALPERKQEAWRYTSVEGLMSTPFAAPDAADLALILSNLEATLPPLGDTWRLVFLNGRWSPDHSDLHDLPDGVRAGSLSEALAADPDGLALWFAAAARHEPQLFTALNAALAGDGPFVQVPAGRVLERPIEIIHVTGGVRSIHCQPRGLIALGVGSRATVIERFLGVGAAGVGEVGYFHHPLTEVAIGVGADLAHYRLQAEAPLAHHLSHLFIDPGQASRYRGVTLSFGGTWARTELNVDFRSEGAEVELGGLYTVGDGQLNDIHLDVRHRVPGCTSRDGFKGILHGHGRAVFDGRVLVAKAAQRTDAQLTNHNLLLCRDAEIDTKPQLEIYADDVRCSHGTTVGQIEPERVFYLRSRGIDEATARRMLSLGFAGEVIETIDHAPLREEAYARLAAAMGGTGSG